MQPLATNLYELLDEAELKHFDEWTLGAIRSYEEYLEFRKFVVDQLNDSKDYWLRMGWPVLYEHFLKSFQH